MTLASQFVPFSIDDPKPAVEYWADFYGVNADMMYQTIECESHFRDGQSHFVKNGRRERSFGIAQINLDAHSDITREQAEDPQFALSWMAREWRDGRAWQWSCFNQRFPGSDPVLKRQRNLQQLV